MNDERLMALYKEAVDSRAAGTRGDCSSPEQISDVVEGRGSEEERLRSLDHIMQCPHCVKEFELLRSITEAQRQKVRVFQSRQWAIAAGILLLVGAGVVWQLASPRDPLFRGGVNRVTLVEPLGTVAARDSREYSWSSAGSNATYAFELLAPSGAQLYRATTRDSFLMIPDSVILDSGVRYRWWVRVMVLGEPAPAPALVEFQISGN